MHFAVHQRLGWDIRAFKSQADRVEADQLIEQMLEARRERWKHAA